MDTISDRYLRTLDKINTVCMKTGRDTDQVKLVVVTKKQSADKILEVIQAGASNLGENYPEEAYAKINSIVGHDDIQWHMIGHIQRRKLKYVLEFCNIIHTIDRLEIALSLDKQCKEACKTMPALLEVNISGESNKYGFYVEENDGRRQLFHAVEHILNCDTIQLHGLMTMPPFTTEPEESRRVFRQCKLLQEEIRAKFNLPSFTQLSMGTSQDYSVAIQEGSTYLRIGEAIMGERSYL